MFRQIRFGQLGLRPCAPVDLNVWDALDIDDLPTGAELGAHLGNADKNKAPGAQHDIFLDEATEKVLVSSSSKFAHAKIKTPFVSPLPMRRPHNLTVAREWIGSEPAYPCDLIRRDAPSKACDSA